MILVIRSIRLERWQPDCYALPLPSLSSCRCGVFNFGYSTRNRALQPPRPSLSRKAQSLDSGLTHPFRLFAQPPDSFQNFGRYLPK